MSASAASSSCASRSGVGFVYRTLAVSTRKCGPARAAAGTACTTPMLATTTTAWNTTEIVAVPASAKRRKHHAADANGVHGQEDPHGLRVQDGERRRRVERDEPQDDEAEVSERDDPHGHEQDLADPERASRRTGVSMHPHGADSDAGARAAGNGRATTPPSGGQ